MLDAARPTAASRSSKEWGVRFGRPRCAFQLQQDTAVAGEGQVARAAG